MHYDGSTEAQGVLEPAGLPKGSWVDQLDWLCWVDRRNCMLVDDLHTCAPDKLECEIVERSDLTLKPDPDRQKDRYFNSVIAKVLQEYVLET